MSPRFITGRSNSRKPTMKEDFKNTMFITKKIMANWRSWAMCIAIAFGCTVGAQETEEMSVKGEPPAEILWSTDFERRVQTPLLVDETQLSVISVSHFESGLYHDVRLWHVKSQSGKKEEIATLGQGIASWGGTGATSILGNERGFFIKDGTKIVAMEVETGNVSWESAVPEGGLRNLAFAEPGIIVANTSEGNVWALDARSGEMIWKFRVRSAEHSRFARRVVSHPLVGLYDKVYFSASKTLYAIDVATGELAWTHESKNNAGLAPQALTADGSVIVTDTWGAEIQCVGPDGERKWKFHAGAGAGIYSAPFIDSRGAIYFVAGQAVLHAIGGEAGEVLWKYKIPRGGECLGIGRDGTIYARDGYDRLVALTPEDGNVKWRLELDGQPTWFAEDNNGILYLGVNPGKLVAIKTDLSRVHRGIWPTYQGNMQRSGQIVRQAPQIVDQPKRPVALTKGLEDQLEVEAYGVPEVEFQWNKDGMPIDGATEATLSFANVTEEDAGQYSVTVRNELGAVDSGVFEVEVTEPRFQVMTSISGQGRIIREPDLGALPKGEKMSLTAIPEEGFMFVGWEGDVNSASNPLDLTVTETLDVTARFDPVFELDVSVADGAGEITVTPKQDEYVDGTKVKLVAEPDEGFGFRRWSGNVGGDDPEIDITMDSDKAIEAHFAPLVRLSTEVEGEGEIRTTPSGNEFLQGTTVTLKANAAEGWRFQKWTGGAEFATNPIEVNLEADTQVGAAFQRVHDVITDVVGEGEVVLSPEQDGYLPGTEVRIEAVPSPGYQFVGWGGDASGAESSIALVIDEDKEVAARFESTWNLDIRRAPKSDMPGRLVLSGGIAGKYRVEFSSLFLEWSELKEVDHEGESTEIIDSDAEFLSRRFYRVRLIEPAE